VPGGHATASPPRQEEAAVQTPPRTLYVFESSGREGLMAFTADESGGNLPVRHGPWVARISIGRAQKPPHRLSRASIEAGIARDGFQLWRRTRSDRPDQPPR